MRETDRFALTDESLPFQPLSQFVRGEVFRRFDRAICSRIDTSVGILIDEFETARRRNSTQIFPRSLHARGENFARRISNDCRQLSGALAATNLSLRIASSGGNEDFTRSNHFVTRNAILLDIGATQSGRRRRFTQ